MILFIEEPKNIVALKPSKQCQVCNIARANIWRYFELDGETLLGDFQNLLLGLR